MSESCPSFNQGCAGRPFIPRGGAGRGKGKNPRGGAGRGEGENLRGGAGRGEKARKSTNSKFLQKCQKYNITYYNIRSRIFEEPSSAFEEEMRKYEANDQDAPEGTDMLQWWKQHALEYPRFERAHKN